MTFGDSESKTKDKKPSEGTNESEGDDQRKVYIFLLLIPNYDNKIKKQLGTWQC